MRIPIATAAAAAASRATPAGTTPLPPGPPSPPPPAPPEEAAGDGGDDEPRRSRKGLVLLLAIVAVVALAGAAFALGSDDDGGDTAASTSTTFQRERSTSTSTSTSSTTTSTTLGIAGDTTTTTLAATTTVAKGTAANGSYGSDPTLDRLAERCQAGDFAACDELYRRAPANSDYERYGDTCGERNEPGGFCTEIYGDGDPQAGAPDTYGDDEHLDSLWDACATGSYGSCDALYAESGPGTDYERFGQTCGNRNQPAGLCTELYQ